MTARRHTWTPADLAVLQAQYPSQRSGDIAVTLGVGIRSLYAQAWRMGLRKGDAFFATDKSGRIFKGGTLSQANQFKPGQKPWNTGQSYDAGGRSHETRFRKGALSGAALHNWVPVGSYRVNSEGILDCKVTDLGRGPRDWESVARLVWKAANGPIPDRHIIVFRPGRKTADLARITLDAIECISRAENARRNHPHRRSPELSSLYQLKGAITRQVNRIQQQSQTTP